MNDYTKRKSNEISIDAEEKEWEEIIEMIEQEDRKKIRKWKGQYSADEQYEGYGEYFD